MLHACLPTCLHAGSARAHYHSSLPCGCHACLEQVWHNYGFDRHVLANLGIYGRGFAGDTMHMARLYDASRTCVYCPDRPWCLIRPRGMRVYCL